MRRTSAIALMLMATAIGAPASVGAAGVALVKDVARGAASSLVADPSFAEIGGVVYFAARTGGLGVELFRTEGTRRTTRLVKDIGQGDAMPSGFTAVGGAVLFAATEGESGTSGRELWRTDGTRAGTRLVRDIHPGDCDGATLACSSNPSSLTQLDGLLYFFAGDGRHGYELWRSDGTSDGTELVKDIFPGRGSSNPRSVFGSAVVADGLLFFSADDGIHGREVWRSDGTADGTYVLDIRPGPGTSNPSGLVEAAGGSLFFGANDGRGPGLWRTDGTEEGTALVKKLPSYLSQVAAVNDVLFFTVGNKWGALWRSDGTAAGTEMLKAFRRPSWLVAGPGQQLFFVADDEAHGPELWRSDGTVGGTRLVRDIHVGKLGEGPSGLTRVGRAILFAATAEGGRELWTSRGTPGTTRRVKDIRPGPKGSSPTALTSLGRKLFFSADDGRHGGEPWTWTP